MKARTKKIESKTYEPPFAEVIQIDMPTVLCTSGAIGVKGNSTESVTTQSFIFP